MKKENKTILHTASTGVGLGVILFCAVAIIALLAPFLYLFLLGWSQGLPTKEIIHAIFIAKMLP